MSLLKSSIYIYVIIKIFYLHDLIYVNVAIFYICLFSRSYIYILLTYLILLSSYSSSTRSGTLSYIFNTFKAGMKFSDVIDDAKNKGFTGMRP